MTPPPADPVPEVPDPPPDPLHELRAIYSRPNLTWRTPDIAPQDEEWLEMLAFLYMVGAPSITVPVLYHFTTGSGPAFTVAEWAHLQQSAAENDPHQRVLLDTICIELPFDLDPRTDVLLQVALSRPSELDLSADRRYLTVTWA